MLLQTVVTLLNLAARKAGLAAPPGEAAPKRDLEQVRQAIEGARALMPLVEQRHGDKLGPVRDTLSQLQMAYAQLAQGGGGARRRAPAGAAGRGRRRSEPDDEGRGPAQQSGPPLGARAVARR